MDDGPSDEAISDVTVDQEPKIDTTMTDRPTSANPLPDEPVLKADEAGTDAEMTDVGAVVVPGLQEIEEENDVEIMGNNTAGVTKMTSDVDLADPITTYCGFAVGADFAATRSCQLHTEQAHDASPVISDGIEPLPLIPAYSGTWEVRGPEPPNPSSDLCPNGPRFWCSGYDYPCYSKRLVRGPDVCIWFLMPPSPEYEKPEGFLGPQVWCRAGHEAPRTAFNVDEHIERPHTSLKCAHHDTERVKKIKNGLDSIPVRLNHIGQSELEKYTCTKAPWDDSRVYHPDSTDARKANTGPATWSSSNESWDASRVKLSCLQHAPQNEDPAFDQDEVDTRPAWDDYREHACIQKVLSDKTGFLSPGKLSVSGEDHLRNQEARSAGRPPQYFIWPSGTMASRLLAPSQQRTEN